MRGAPRDRRQRDGLSSTTPEGMPLSAKRTKRLEPPLLVVDVSLAVRRARPRRARSTFLGRPSALRAHRHRRRPAHRRDPGAPLGTARRRRRRQRGARGRGDRGCTTATAEAIRQLMGRRHRRHRDRRAPPARRAAGVGRAARAERDARLLLQRPHVVLGGRTTPAPCGCCASSPTTSSSPTRLAASGSPARLVPGAAARRGGARRPWPLRQAATRRVREDSPAAGRARQPAWLAQAAREDSDVVVATYDELATFGLEDLPARRSSPRPSPTSGWPSSAARDVDMVLDTTPQPFDVTVDAAMLEAMMRATVRAPAAPERLTDDDLLEMIVAAGLEPRLLYPNGPRRKSRFAFVIHPLSQKFFTKVEPLGTISRVSPPSSTTPWRRRWPTPRRSVYSHVTGITSPTGAEAEGWLITRRRHPEGAHGPQPGVHLRPAARRPPRWPASSAPRSWGSARSPRSSATPG